MRTHSHRLILLVFGIISLSAGKGFAQEEESTLAQYYGFKPVEVFKLAERSGNLLNGDLNHDGLTDLILVDDSHSRLD